MEVSCFLGLPPNPLGRIIHNKNLIHLGIPAAPKKHPKSPWRLALPSPPPGHSSRGRTSLAAAPWSHWQIRGEKPPKIMGTL